VWHEAVALDLARELGAFRGVDEIAECLLRAEIDNEFSYLTNGGNPWSLWDRVANSARIRKQIENNRALLRERQKRARMTPKQRREVNTRRAEIYRLKIATVVAVRWCRHCKQPYGFTAWAQDANDKQRYCSIKCALSDRAELLTLNGRTQGLNAWCSELGVAPATVQKRLKAGLSVEEAFAKKVSRGDPRYNSRVKIPISAVDEIRSARQRGEVLSVIVARYGVGKSTLQSFLRRHDIKSSSVGRLRAP
jgi:hypothetical protein